MGYRRLSIGSKSPGVEQLSLDLGSLGALLTGGHSHEPPVFARGFRRPCRRGSRDRPILSAISSQLGWRPPRSPHGVPGGRQHRARGEHRSGIRQIPGVHTPSSRPYTAPLRITMRRRVPPPSSPAYRCFRSSARNQSAKSRALGVNSSTMVRSETSPSSV